MIIFFRLMTSRLRSHKIAARLKYAKLGQDRNVLSYLQQTHMLLSYILKY